MNTQSYSFWSQAGTSDWSFKASTSTSVKAFSSQSGSPGPARGFGAPHAPEPIKYEPSASVYRGSMGYFAFLPNNVQTPSTGVSDSEKQKNQDDAEARREQRTEAEQASIWEARLKKDAEVRQQQISREESEARRGEEEWVRSGGILRDAEGRRDMVKTQAIRDELKLREVEAQLVRKWEAYERRWQALSAGSGDAKATVTFQDIPWPVDVETHGTLELRDLDVKKVEDFLLGGLKVRGNRVTKKDRVRGSLLRWHPDKMTAILGRVVDDDMEAVKQGVGVVMACLQGLNAKV